MAILHQYRRLAPPSGQTFGNWIIRAGYSGHIPAATSAGDLYLHGGRLVPQDLGAALFFYLMAAASDEPAALRQMWNLQRAIIPFMPFNDLFQRLMEAAQAGEPEAEIIVYRCLMENQAARML